MRRLLLTAARVGNAHWFFGNLYEEVVRMPDRMAADPGAGLLRPGSPVRYHLPAAPLTVVATIAAAVTGRRPALVTAAACTSTGTALTAYLVVTVIRRLLGDGPPLAPDEQARLTTRWHQVNRVRLVLAAASSIALESAAQETR